MSSGYQFPLLSLENAVTGLRTINLQVDENDFKKPNPARWQEIFSMMLESLTNTPVDLFLQHTVHMTENIENPELYEEAMPLLLLTMGMQRVMCACGVTNFTIRDITEPNSKRLVRIASAVINFYRFKELRMVVFHQLKEENERYREQYDHLLKVNDELKAKINNIKAARAEQEPEIIRVQQEIEELTRQMQEHHREQATVQKTVNEIKASIAERRAAIDQMKLAILKAREESDKLSQKIVQSPERVKEEQENMKRQLVGLKSSLEGKRERLLELQQQKEGIKLSEANVEKGLKLLEAIQADIEKENEIANEIASIIDRCQEQKTKLGDIHVKKEQLLHMYSTRQEKISKLSLQHQAKMHAAEERLNELKLDQEGALKQQNNEQAKTGDLVQQREKMKESINAKQRELDGKIENITHAYSEILEKLDKYHKDLGQGWEEIRQVLDQGSSIL